MIPHVNQGVQQARRTGPEHPLTSEDRTQERIYFPCVLRERSALSYVLRIHVTAGIQICCRCFAGYQVPVRLNVTAASKPAVAVIT
jgi:hypothetical protein